MFASKILPTNNVHVKSAVRFFVLFVVSAKKSGKKERKRGNKTNHRENNYFWQQERKKVNDIDTVVASPSPGPWRARCLDSANVDSHVWLASTRTYIAFAVPFMVRTHSRLGGELRYLILLAFITGHSSWLSRPHWNSHRNSFEKEAFSAKTSNPLTM